MESNEQAELARKMWADSEIESRMTAIGVGRLEVEGLNKKEKGLMDMENSVGVAGGIGEYTEGK